MGSSIKLRNKIYSKGIFLMALLVVSLCLNSNLLSCTVVIKVANESVFVGNNEDYTEPRTSIWFEPPVGELYGYTIWGYDRYMWEEQGGMNDQGLFVDILAVRLTDWVNEPGKEDFEEDVIRHSLSRFATVGEVIDFFQKYDVDLSNIRFAFADAIGESVIIEWGKGELQFLKREKPYQIATNFIFSENEKPTERCTRYKLAEQILSGPEQPSVDLIRRVLSATSFQAYYCKTMYSNICDLKNKKLCLYHFHNFEEVVEFDLVSELQKGRHSYAIPSLFDIKPFSELFFDRIGSRIGGKEFIAAIEEKGIEGGLEWFKEVSEENTKFDRYIFGPWVLYCAAMHFLSNDKINEAFAIHELNIKSNPEAAMAYFGMGEANEKIGKIEKAILNYKKALELDPEYIDAQKKLAEME